MTDKKGVGDKIFEIESEDEEIRMTPEIAQVAYEAY